MGSGTASEPGGESIDSALHVTEDRLKGRTPEVLHTCFITPATATPVAKEWLPLCPLDLLWMPFYTPLLCTFTVDQVRSRFGSGVVQHLKESLAEALVLFYPLAGRVVTTDGPPRIHCNDAGAVFTEATVDVELVELRTDDFQPVPLLAGFAAAGLANYPVLPQIPTGLPALIIQVTHFKCGGLSLAANWSHAAADGRSGLHFMKSWSEIARGAQVSLVPDHRRELVKPRNPAVPCDMAKAVAISAGAGIAVENNEQSNTGSNPTTTTKQKKVAVQTVEFTKDEIAQLRNRAGSDPNLTRADCLSTHLWRTITRARKLPSNARVRLWVMIEGREKCGLPAGYFGNVTGLTPVITTVDELLNGPIGATASLIHAGVASVTGEWFQGMADRYATVTENLFAPEPLGPGADCSVSYLVRFPYYELDFGFGAPAHSTRNTEGAWNGLVFNVPSSRGKEHMVAMANLDPDAASAFLTLAHDLRD